MAWLLTVDYRERIDTTLCSQLSIILQSWTE